MTATLEAPSAPREAMSDYEIERGKPMPSKNHAWIQANLIVAIHQSRDYRPGSEMTLDIGLGHPVTPDISVHPRQEMELWNDEIRVTDIQPDQRDNMVPRVRGQRPMIWAFLDSERED